MSCGFGNAILTLGWWIQWLEQESDRMKIKIPVRPKESLLEFTAKDTISHMENLLQNTSLKSKLDPNEISEIESSIKYLKENPDGPVKKK